MAHVAYIYTLSDPRTEKVRYVGKTDHLEKRLQSHIRDSRRSTRPVNRWINELLAMGILPTIACIEQVTSESWPEREIYWIDSLRETCHLLNIHRGGQQVNNSIETLQKGGRSAAVARTLPRDGDTRVPRINAINRKLGEYLFFLRKNGKVEEHNEFLARLRESAKTRPLLSHWLTVKDARHAG